MNLIQKVEGELYCVEGKYTISSCTRRSFGRFVLVVVSEGRTFQIIRTKVVIPANSKVQRPRKMIRARLFHYYMNFTLPGISFEIMLDLPGCIYSILGLE